MGDFELKKRTEMEQVAYLVGKYFTGEITLVFLKIQLDAIKEPYQCPTVTAS